jgi:hypothetical protein
MYLTRKDIEKISSILAEFPDLDVFEINQDSSSGIGSCTSITFAREISGIKGSFEVEISGVEDW